jgi:hypothetical protein
MVVERISGTPAATPADPAVAGDHVKLARVRVRAAATSITAADITDLRTYTGAVGAIILARNAADRPANPYQGLYVHRLDSNRLELWDGTAWRAPLEDDTGWADATIAANWVVGSPSDSDEAALRVRRVGRSVYLRGAVARRNSAATSSVVVATVPLAFRPRWAHRWTAPGMGTIAGSLQSYELALMPDGNLYVFPDPGQVPVNEVIFLHTSWLLEP